MSNLKPEHRKIECLQSNPIFNFNQKPINNQKTMKKRFAFLAVTALLSVGLAFYVNQQNSTQVLLESDVEALTGSGDPGGGSPYMEFGSSPSRVIVDMETHTLVFEDKIQDKDKDGNLVNGCIQETGSTCVINTTTAVYNIGQIMSFLADILKAAMPMILQLLALH